MANKVTILDVAKASGYGVGTVSRVLSGEASVKESTRQKILKVIEELNYTPNVTGARLRTQHSGVIAVMVPIIFHPFFSEFLEDVESAAAEKGYSILLVASQMNVEKEREILRKIKRKEVDGAIFVTHYEHDDADLKDCPQRQRLTVDILFDRSKLPGEIKTLIFDYKAADHQLLFIPACYLGGPPGAKKGAYRWMPFADRIAPGNRWYTAKVPVDQMTVEGKKIADQEICRVRLSIFFNVHDKPTTVWFGNVRISNRRLAVPPTLRIEKVSEHGEEVAPPTPGAL